MIQGADSSLEFARGGAHARGYAGGSKANHLLSLGDHSETIEIEYVRRRSPTRSCWRCFWGAGSGRAVGISQQYASIIHYPDEAPA